jgi:catechol 2,3-dioxygenase-like lactoylglutathione lyase family enzyme
MSERTITGIHHVTAIAGDPQLNLNFYTEALGLRLVKLTVNFDDPGTYHFYFGDTHGSPGSILTFFPWAGVPRGVVGDGQVCATSFAVPAGSLEFWRDRLAERGAAPEDAEPRFGERVLRLADPDGLPLELVATDASAAPWTTEVPAEHAIRGFHSATLAEEGYEETAALLRDVMGLREVGHEGNRYRFQMAQGGPASIVDVVVAPDGRPGRLGTGTVHHIAWRTPDDAQQLAWRKQLVGEGFNVSPVMDRTYFHSIYYREPGGILFEIATDPPGFALDEDPDHLGERLMLPAQFESHRKTLERALPPLTLPHQKSEQRR